MRSTEERDEQTLAIAAALLMVVACVVVGGLALWLADRMLGVGDAWSPVLVVAFAVGCVLAVRHLRGR